MTRKIRGSGDTPRSPVLDTTGTPSEAFMKWWAAQGIESTSLKFAAWNGWLAASSEIDACPGATNTVFHTKGCQHPDAAPSAIAPPTEKEIAAYRDLFRIELDKNMNNSSGSPSTDAHTVALHRFVSDRNKRASTDGKGDTK